MISQKDPKSKGIEGAFMEKSEMRKLAEFIEKLSWDDLPEEVKTTVSFRVLDLISAALGAVDDPLVKKVKASYLERNNGTGGIHTSKITPASTAGIKALFPFFPIALDTSMAAVIVNNATTNLTSSNIISHPEILT